jgi:DNA repair exonuclease SbcCD nuclease subunit
MRICHLSDSHLGAGEGFPRRGSSGLTLRQEDVVAGFVDAIDQIIALKPDLCLHTGDLFHHVRPTNRILALAGDQLHRLAEERGIPTVIICGNHDSPRQPHIGAALDVFGHVQNLYIASASELRTFRFGDTIIWALPHCVTGETLTKETAGCAPDSSARYNILMAHGVAAGMPEFRMVELGEQEISLDVINRFSYTALGHYHNCVQVAPRAWYAGSTERLSQSERESRKGFLEVELNPLSIRFHEVRCRAMIDLPVIRAEGLRGDQVVEAIEREMAAGESEGKVTRVTVEGITEETLRTIPRERLAALREKAFDLDIRLNRKQSADLPQIGRAAMGRLDLGFIEYLKSVDLNGLAPDRIIQLAEQYLQGED